MRIKVLLLSCLLFTGCYTQLSMFNPEVEDEIEDIYSYSAAGPMKSVGMYAQDGAGQSLGLAYQMMYNRFSGFMGYGNGYSYYSPYGGYYNNSYTLGGYTMYVPLAKFPDRGTPRTWTRDSKSSGTNLNITRTNTTESGNNDSGQTNGSNVSSTRSSSGGSSNSSSGSKSRIRVTKRN